MILKTALMGKSSSLSQKQKMKVSSSVTIVEGYIFRSNSSSIIFFSFFVACVPNYLFCHHRRMLTFFILVPFFPHM